MVGSQIIGRGKMMLASSALMMMASGCSVDTSGIEPGVGGDAIVGLLVNTEEADKAVKVACGFDEDSQPSLIKGVPYEGGFNAVIPIICIESGEDQ